MTFECNSDSVVGENFDNKKFVMKEDNRDKERFVIRS
jgi:hypothetical protein